MLKQTKINNKTKKNSVLIALETKENAQVLSTISGAEGESALPRKFRIPTLPYLEPEGLKEVQMFHACTITTRDRCAGRLCRHH